MAFTAADVKALREKTGVGMMECKKALVETDGDMEKAIDVLRERGLAVAAKKASKVAADGVVSTYTDGKETVILEVNAQTDFVAKNEKFLAFVEAVAKTILAVKPADVDALLAATICGGTESVEATRQELVLTIGENISVRRFEILEGHVITYVHGGATHAVAVKFDAADDIAAQPGFVEMGKDVAMQIAAMSPSYLDEASVPADVIEHEKTILLAQMAEDPKMANKPEMAKAKIVEGKLRKFYEENCLLKQAFVKDGDINVGQYIENTAKKLGGDIKAVCYIHYVKGEGIEKKTQSFADEVAEAMGEKK